MNKNGMKPSPPFLARRRKNFAHHPLRFPHPHVENLRAFDVHEILTHVIAGLPRSCLVKL